MQVSTIDKAKNIPSIPSKYQRILTNSKPIKQRFSNNYDLKKQFNTEPGPGSYNKRDSKSQQRSRRQGIGFDTGEERFAEIEDGMVGPEKPGPGTYNAEKPEKHKMCMSFYYKPGAAPVFNENNPLNYARPITVNVYFKSENPPPGYYDVVDRPKTQSYQTGHRHLFTSQNTRNMFNIKNDVPDIGAYDIEAGIQSALIRE